MSGGRPTVLLTGAAGGIGSAIGEQLEADGWEVVGVDIAPEDPSLACDLTTREGNRRAVEIALERHGRLDAVVANAGVQHVAPIEEFPEDRWDELIALMLTSPFLLARSAWPALARAPEGGCFVAIASVHGLVASPGKAAYAAAKHGVVGLVRTLALEGADAGIRATALCPGYVRTPLVERQVTDLARQHGLSEEDALRDVLLAPHPIKRLIDPAEVAAAVAFLLGPDGTAFNGAPLAMDLGWTAR
jgi:3-hydroxybutyrate dehydrogenase